MSMIFNKRKFTFFFNFNFYLFIFNLVAFLFQIYIEIRINLCLNEILRDMQNIISKNKILKHKINFFIAINYKIEYYRNLI
jgi:hypothetical protein